MINTHDNTISISFVIILSGSRYWVIIAEATHILIFIMFFAFDGCILTRIERRFSENCDDFTVIDPDKMITNDIVGIA